MNLKLKIRDNNHKEESKMKIQVLSDLHLELLNMEKLWGNTYSIDCDVLCLVGDIGDPKSDIYWSFIEYVRKHAKYVLVVSGNHECWGMSPYEVDHILSIRCGKLNNVEYLQKGVFFYGGFVFLGCTLWSHIPSEYHSKFEIQFPDFSKIQDCTPMCFNMWHNDHLSWLKNALLEAKNREMKTVVLTHYTPLHNLSHSQRYKGDPTQHMFSTDLRYLYNHVDVWCYGHTHADRTGHTYKVNGKKTLFVSNQRGYPNYVRYKFDSSFSLSLPSDFEKKYPVYPEKAIDL